MKKILALTALTALVLCVCMAAGCGCGRKKVLDEPEATLPDLNLYKKPQEKDFLWVDENGGIAITGYTGDIEYVYVPDEIGGSPVKVIGSGAFAHTEIQGVLIPDSVVQIEDLAFNGCTALKEVDCGHGLVELGYGAFEECYALETVLLRGGLEVIGEVSFGFCYSLKSISIPQSVIMICDQAFYKSGLEFVDIPGGVESVYAKTFFGCESLKKATISEGVKFVGDDVFEGCPALETIVLPASVTKIGRMISDNPAVVIKAPKDSAAEVYAQNYDFAFEALPQEGE